MAIGNISNGESGLSIRTKLNAVIDTINTGLTDVFVTGGTLTTGGTATFTNNTGGTFNITGFTSGYVPIGGVIAWLKSYTNTSALPVNYVECNGQVLSNAASVYNGQVIPNLNGASSSTKRFLRGSTTSGTVGGSETHTHTLSTVTIVHIASSGGVNYYPNAVSNGNTGAASSLPSYYEVVYVIRIT